jgi:hypothetical protein
MDVLFPVGYLHNKVRGTFHPIVFRPSPRPSDGEDTTCRFRSAGHHTEGFATFELAKDLVSKNPKWKECGIVWSWDGVSSPHMSQDFDTSLYKK